VPRATPDQVAAARPTAVKSQTTLLLTYTEARLIGRERSRSAVPRSISPAGTRVPMVTRVPHVMTERNGSWPMTTSVVGDAPAERSKLI